MGDRFNYGGTGTLARLLERLKAMFGGFATTEQFESLSETIDKLLASDDDEIEMLIEADLLPAVTTASGAILTDENGNVILRY